MYNIFYKLYDLHNREQILEKGLLYPFSNSNFYENKQEYYQVIQKLDSQIKDFLEKISETKDNTELDDISKNTFYLKGFMRLIQDELKELKNFCQLNNINIEDEVESIESSISYIENFNEEKKEHISYRGSYHNKSFSHYGTIKNNFNTISDFLEDDALLYLDKNFKNIVYKIEDLKKNITTLESNKDSIDKDIKALDCDDEDYDDQYDTLLEEKENIEKEIKEKEKEIKEYEEDSDSYIEKYAIESLKYIEHYQYSKIFDILNDTLNELEDLKDNVIIQYRNKEFNNYIGKSQAQIYFESSPIQRVILDKQDQCNSIFKINYNKFIIFSDNSYLFSISKDQYILPNSNHELKNISLKFLNHFIEYFFRKHPIYNELFKNTLKNNLKEKPNDIFDTLKLFNSNLSFVEKYFNPINDFSKKTFEQISDLIQNKMIDVKTDNEIKNIFSNKNKFLYTQSIHNELKNLIAASSLSALKEVEKKLSLFKDEESFKSFIKKIRSELNGFSMDSTLMKIDDTSKIIYKNEDTNLLILKISTFQQSKLLGTNKWCISRTESLFDNYTTNRFQYFIYDFNKDPSDYLSKIGITLNKNGVYHTAHYGNDIKAKEEDLYNFIKTIYQFDSNFNLTKEIQEKYQLEDIIKDKKIKFKI